MSSWGIRMELIRIALCAPCHQGEGSLHLAHADGPPCDIAYSTRGKNSIQLAFHLIRISHNRMGEEDIPRVDILHPDISQPDGRGGRFNFSGQTCADPLITLTRRVFLSVYSTTVFS